MNYPMFVKNTLFHLIHDMSLSPDKFVQHPHRDFTRKRKLDFDTMFHLFLSLESKNLASELLNFFHFSTHTPSVSAFYQQRKKILPSAFEFLFHSFNHSFPSKHLFHGYRLIACDGSDFNIPCNLNDSSTYFQALPDYQGYNLLHLNACFDLLSRRFLDVLVTPGRNKGECDAMVTMLERYPANQKSIFIADRGYESFNVFAHAQEQGLHYLIRVKDRDSNGRLSTFSLPDSDTFDTDISFSLTRKQTKEIKLKKELYHVLTCNRVKFDYLDAQTPFYPMTLRVLRFPISKGRYECVITNLDREEFPMEKIKKIYQMRWGIETSFRQLKYAVELVSFHTKKVEYIQQELFARLILYNFCEIITEQIVIEQKNRRHTYQLNYTQAVYICRYFLRCARDIPPPDVVPLIKKYLLPVKPGRTAPRKVKCQPVVSFLYRLT